MGKVAALPPKYAQVEISRVPVVMPGMWDCHAHLMGVPVLDLERIALDPLALRAARSVTDLRAALDSGLTSVREC